MRISLESFIFTTFECCLPPATLARTFHVLLVRVMPLFSFPCFDPVEWKLRLVGLGTMSNCAPAGVVHGALLRAICDIG